MGRRRNNAINYAYVARGKPYSCKKGKVGRWLGGRDVRWTPTTPTAGASSAHSVSGQRLHQEWGISLRREGFQLSFYFPLYSLSRFVGSYFARAPAQEQLSAISLTTYPCRAGFYVVYGVCCAYILFFVIPYMHITNHVYLYAQNHTNK